MGSDASISVKSTFKRMYALIPEKKSATVRLRSWWAINFANACCMFGVWIDKVFRSVLSLVFSAAFGLLLTPCCRGAVKGNEAVCLAAFAGGAFLVGFLEVGDDAAGIDLGGGDAAVAEELLDVPDGGSAAEHFGGAGVAEAVQGEGVREAGCVAVSAKHGA